MAPKNKKGHETKSCLYLPSQDAAFDSMDRIKGGVFFGKHAGMLDEDLIANSDCPEFHIGQSYEEKPAQAIKCILCGSNVFNVGHGEWYTAIRCVHCQWEFCIHEG